MMNSDVPGRRVGWEKRGGGQLPGAIDVRVVSQPKLAPLVRELPWTHNLLIMGRCKRDDEREFYLRACLRERWGKRELDCQLAGALFERTVLSPPNLSPVVTELHPEAVAVFKETYLVEQQAALPKLEANPTRATSRHRAPREKRRKK